MPRGGARKGSGRPIGSTKSDKKVMISVKIDPKLKAWLKKQDNQARTVEAALTEHKNK